ncbi:MAG: hypothetical protein UEU47_05890 [Oscillospiraceae bacterium]|nr:hypothetical protein [Oscillospiraceae bacterium]
MKIIITIEIKQTPKPQKKSPVRQKPEPSNSKNNNIIINQK